MTDEFDRGVLATAVERRSALATLAREPSHLDAPENDVD